MKPSKHWNLYASNHHLGDYREHRLAGARIGPFAVNVDYTTWHGWKFTIHVRPFHIEFGKASSPDRKRQLIDHLERMPGFRSSMERSLRDSDEGRGYRMDTSNPDAPMKPVDTWRPDDTKQPEGWHHDGTDWVLDEEGWTQDRSGFWRYTKPGDFGWVLRENRWEYLRKDPSGTFIDMNGRPIEEGKVVS